MVGGSWAAGVATLLRIRLRGHQLEVISRQTRRAMTELRLSARASISAQMPVCYAAVSALVLFAACVNLTPPWAGRNDAGDLDGLVASDTATGGSGGGPDAASGGSGGGAAPRDATVGGAGGLEAGGTTAQATGDAGGSYAADAGSVGDGIVPRDGGIDVPYVADGLPLDQGTGGSDRGGADSGAGGSSGSAGQGGGAEDAATATGGTVAAGGSALTDAGVAGSGGGTSGTAGRSGGGGDASSSGGVGGAGATGGSGGSASTGTTPTGGATTTCAPVPKSAGGISCPGGFCSVGPYSGYDFSLDDKTGKSSVCVSAGSLCGAGTTGAQDPPSYTVWGAGFGFNLAPQSTVTNIVPVQLSGTSVTVALSSLPTGASMRVQVTVGGAAYCAVMTAATQTIPWTTFNTKCWAPTTGTALAAAPNTPNIQFLASSLITAGSFDFCVTSLSFQ